MTDRLRIRPAVLGDHSALEAIYIRASLANEGDRAALLANPDVLKFPTDRIAKGGVLVAERETAIVGFASVSVAEGGSAELDDLFVEPTQWKRGIGRALVMAALGHAGERGCKLLAVTGNPHALGFYLACRFEEIGPVETQFGPGLRLIRHL